LLQESDLDRIAGDVQTALNEDANFGGTSPSLQQNLPAAFERYRTATAAFIAMTNAASTGTNHVTAAQYVAAGQAAREASFAMWATAAGELDHLLDVRVAGFQHELSTGFGTTGIALLLSMAFVLVLTRSITVPLRTTSTPARSPRWRRWPARTRSAPARRPS